MKMKNSILAVLLLITSALFAQTESFNFENLKHDFGTIEEDDGFATYEFTFTNTGQEPIKINSVKASCGCTTPSWSKEEVAPGQEGHVRARYNPKNRPGKFNKTLTVTTGENEKIYLRISGNVLKAPLPPEKKFPYLSENLRFKSEQINAGAISHNEMKEVNIEIFNTTEAQFKVSEVAQLPAHITVKDTELIVAAGKFANVMFIYDPTKLKDWGIRMDELTFTVGDKQSSVQLQSDIRENFGDMTEEQMAAAPKIALSKTTLNFGDVEKGKHVKSTVMYTNNGQSDLIIRKVSSTCGCTVLKTQKDVIKPGKSGKLLITLNTEEKDYNQNNIITVICNDPKAPIHTIQVRANITE